MTEPAILMKHCSRCKQMLPADLEHFYANTQTTSRLSSECKVCRRAYDHAHRASRKLSENNVRLGRVAGHPQPALTLSQCRHLLADMPIAAIGVGIEQAIDSSQCAAYLRIELAGADFSDIMWIWYSIELLHKYHVDLSFLLQKHDTMAADDE